MSDRSRARVLAVVALMGLAGCKESIPESFDTLVPEKGRGDIRTVSEMDGSGYGAETMLYVAYGTELSDAELNEAYTETVLGAGYTKVLECSVDGAVISTDFLTPSREHVQVFFRLQSDGDRGPLLHVFKSSKLAALNGGKACAFTDAASKLCVALEADVCRLSDF